MELYRDYQLNTAKQEAQRNLMGRTHYVDNETLKSHKSKVLAARAVDDGLLYAIVTSDSLDFLNLRRGFRYVVFDLFGTIVARVNLDEAFSSRKTAERKMWMALNKLDAKLITGEAIERARKNHDREMDELHKKVFGLPLKSEQAAA